MNDTQTRRLSWDWGPDGTESVHVIDGPEGWRVAGRHGYVLYKISATPGFVTRSVMVNSLGPDGTEHSLTLDRETDGWRHRDGPLIPDSAKAIDPDIACTAATNTLPIRRLGLAIGDTAEIDVLYTPLPIPIPRIIRQRYTRLPDGYLYENLENGFSAQLAVDRGGWVTDYPDVCQLKECDQ